MANNNEINTLSKYVEDKSSLEKRISLPEPVSKKHVATRRTQSQNYGHQRPSSVPPTIPEVEITLEEDEPGEIRSRTSSMKSYTSKNNYLSPSNGYKKETPVLTHGYENTTYDGPLPPLYNGFDNKSNLSSKHPSLQSLEVQKEQYCCASKWSPCERKLVAAVAVLATIIVILVIIVGVLAKSDGVDKRFIWTL